MRNQINLLIGLLIFCSTNILAQRESKISVELENDSHFNFGSIDTYDEITDGYSSRSQRKSVGIALQHKTIGIRLNKVDLELQGPGFENPFRIIWATYDNFPREWKKKGGSYKSHGYMFEGYSVGLFKVFNTKLFDIEVNANYGRFDVKINGSNQSGQLFSYVFENEEDFQSRHWAYYDSGSYYSFGANVVKKLWKGLIGYIGVNLRNGNFKYVFNERIIDDLFPENNLDVSNRNDKTFNSFGMRIGIKYQFEFGKPYH